MKNFLVNQEQTGRYIIFSNRTGKRYFIEPIGNTKTTFGDINPATGKIEGSYGTKFKGSVSKNESLITQENFEVVHELAIGESPSSYIEKLDAKYPSI